MESAPSCQNDRVAKKIKIEFSARALGWTRRGKGVVNSEFIVFCYFPFELCVSLFQPVLRIVDWLDFGLGFGSFTNCLQLILTGFS